MKKRWRNFYKAFTIALKFRDKFNALNLVSMPGYQQTYCLDVNGKCEGCFNICGTPFTISLTQF